MGTRCRRRPAATGKIQVGAVPGDSAQVIVPACGVPLAAGTEPNPPDELETDPLELLLLAAGGEAQGPDNGAHRQL